MTGKSRGAFDVDLSKRRERICSHFIHDMHARRAMDDYINIFQRR
jgi:hypothetical protein